VERSSVSRNVPKEPFYIILNTAVGGIMPGNPDATTVFPQYHEIDYVRVYAKEIPGHIF
jgi:beta-glucanase (GH16 family)